VNGVRWTYQRIRSLSSVKEKVQEAGKEPLFTFKARVSRLLADNLSMFISFGAIECLFLVNLNTNLALMFPLFQVFKSLLELM